MKTKIIAVVALMISIPITGEMTEENPAEATFEFPNQIGCELGNLEFKTEETVIHAGKAIPPSDGKVQLKIEDQYQSITIPSQEIKFNIYDVCIEPEPPAEPNLGKTEQKINETSHEHEDLIDEFEAQAEKIRKNAQATVDGLKSGTLLNCNPKTQYGYVSELTAKQILNDGCRHLNGITGNCQSNGDCPCYNELTPLIYAPVPGVDTDGDGVRDEDDEDDDCDYLTDDLEVEFALNPKLPDDPMNLALGGKIPVLAVKLVKICDIHDEDPPGHTSDPYLEGGLAITNEIKDGGAGSYSGRFDISFDFAGFTKEDHSHGTTCIEGTGEEKTFALSSDYLSEFYGNRDESVRGMPQISVVAAIMDHDTNDDDSLGRSLVTEALQTKMPSASGEVGLTTIHLSKATIELDIQASLHKCATSWAYLVSNGSIAVNVEDLDCW